jgi:hypothetical protein
MTDSNRSEAAKRAARTRKWMAAGKLPGLKGKTIDGPKVGVTSNQCQIVLQSDGRYPNIVLWNRTVPWRGVRSGPGRNTPRSPHRNREARSL